MRLLVVNPNTSAEHDPAHRRGGARRGGAGSRGRRRQSGERAGVDRGLFRRSLRRAGPGRGGRERRRRRLRRLHRRLLRRHRPRGGALRGARPGDRHRRSGVPRRLADRPSLQRRHHPVALDRADRGQSGQIRPRRRAARGCAPAKCRCWRSTIAASGARDKLSAEIDRAIAEDGAEAIVLGCAGMAELAAALSRRHGLPVVDGVAAAVRLAEALVGLGLRPRSAAPTRRRCPRRSRGSGQSGSRQ